MPCPLLGSLSAILHMIARCSNLGRRKALMPLGAGIVLLLLGVGLVDVSAAQQTEVALASVSLTSSAVIEGNSLEGTVSLNRPAPNGGFDKRAVHVAAMNDTEAVIESGVDAGSVVQRAARSSGFVG